MENKLQPHEKGYFAAYADCREAPYFPIEITYAETLEELEQKLENWASEAVQEGGDHPLNQYSHSYYYTRLGSFGIIDHTDLIEAACDAGLEAASFCPHREWGTLHNGAGGVI